MNSQADEERDIKLSKNLSYLLRHGAVKEGLNIKSDGFVTVDEIIRKKLLHCSLSDIERIVANDSKKRYALIRNKGVLEIRANQGHSISEICELSLKPVENPNYDIIHGTYLKHWPKIKSKGLSRMKRNYIHFAKGLNFICGLRRNAELYIYIDFDKAKDSNLKFFESENGVILSPGNEQGFIEGKYFSKVITRTGKNLLEET